jgi:hypothetical protein
MLTAPQINQGADITFSTPLFTASWKENCASKEMPEAAADWKGVQIVVPIAA